ncbi:MAG: hypothetical protein JXB23_17715 [Candidatus Aminicenantes bacterium]|nr:hypothetical protein [Candidatus Aminicenantes bacterium]
MVIERKTGGFFLLVGRAAILAAIVIAVIFSGKFTGIMNINGLIFVLIGGAALALMSFSLSDIGRVMKGTWGRIPSSEIVRQSSLFWESSARNFWMVGVLASVILFVLSLVRGEGGIEEIAARMANSFIPTVYGLIMAVVCLVPALKLKEMSLSKNEDDITAMKSDERGRKSTEALKFENIAGYVVFIALIAWTIIKPALSGQDYIIKSWEWVTHWPAFLVVFGGTIAIALFVDGTMIGRTSTLGFTLTGLIGSLVGFVQVLVAFSAKSIQDVASAMTFILSSCFFALLGIMLVGAPLEDRSVKSAKTEKHSFPSRVAWYVFPLVTLIFLAVTFVLIITPVKK